MAKQKTKRAASKRFSISGTGKIRRRPVHQAHFNAKADGNDTRRKHGDQPVSPSDYDRVIDLIPYV